MIDDSVAAWAVDEDGKGDLSGIIISDLLPHATVNNVLQKVSRTTLTCSPQVEVESFMFRPTGAGIPFYFIDKTTECTTAATPNKHKHIFLCNSRHQSNRATPTICTASCARSGPPLTAKISPTRLPRCCFLGIKTSVSQVAAEDSPGPGLTLCKRERVETAGQKASTQLSGCQIPQCTTVRLS